MAFGYTVDKEIHIGGMRIVTGNFTNSSSTGGDIVTGLAVVRQFFITTAGTSIVANASVYNETLPLINTGGTVTIVNTSNENGSWMAIG